MLLLLTSTNACFFKVIDHGRDNFMTLLCYNAHEQQCNNNVLAEDARRRRYGRFCSHLSAEGKRRCDRRIYTGIPPHALVAKTTIFTGDIA